jgi:hypothetical protein
VIKKTLLTFFSKVLLIIGAVVGTIASGYLWQLKQISVLAFQEKGLTGIKSNYKGNTQMKKQLVSIRGV